MIVEENQNSFIRKEMQSKTIKKIILTGPESTGKTTLAQHLAEHFDTIWVPEYARKHLSESNREYTEKDLLKIAKGQVDLEKKMQKKANQFLFCDTSLLVLKIWSEYKYQQCHPYILEELEARKNDFFILCGIDVPWEFDVLREHPNDREELYQIYRTELFSLNANFIETSGNQLHRLHKTIHSLNHIFPFIKK
jgi:NadR type nicotinamide-nucleotide adenylyltransferase